MSIVLESLTKRYGGNAVVSDVSLQVRDGEFFVLLGPSGSGKSTILRMIAGLAELDAGRVLLHGRDVTRLPPKRRGVGLVFQNYALFRHMTVSDNIEFALRIRKVPALARRQRRDELLDLVGLVGFGNRLPRQLSGGQQQRVALARALAHKPDVLLLDEPFGALDARIRAELRRTVRAIQREMKITTIFVTHDQEEAFELADRLGVMDFGRLLEVGAPWDLYLHPHTEFVATFLGTANLMVGERRADGVHLGPVRFPEPPAPEQEHGRVQVLFRPEDVAAKDSAEALSWPLLGEATVEESGFAGPFERLRLRLPKLDGVRPISPPVPYGADFFVLEATRPRDQARRFPLRPGDRAWVGVRRVHVLSHPGLSFLLCVDGTPEGRAALELGGQVARLAHARVTLLACGADATAAAEEQRWARQQLGSGLAGLNVQTSGGGVEEAIALASSRQHYDLVVVGRPPRRALERAEELLQGVDPHLLLVPAPRPVPVSVLICVEIGEPGKADVQFTGRLVRHIGATSTILSVLSAGASAQAVAQAERFLSAGERSLALLGVPARAALRTGDPYDEIVNEHDGGGHDLLVLGAPFPDRRGRVALDGLVGRLAERHPTHPVLIVRSDAGRRP